MLLCKNCQRPSVLCNWVYPGLTKCKLRLYLSLAKSTFYKGLIADALEHGAKVINSEGGQSAGSLMRPALLYPVNSQMRLYQEEQFGPLVPVVPYDDISEVIHYVIHSDYGQQLSIFGQDARQIGELVDMFANQVGRININSQCQRSPDSFPFTGRKTQLKGRCRWKMPCCSFLSPLWWPVNTTLNK